MKKLIFVLLLTGCASTQPPSNMTDQELQIWLYRQQQIQQNLDSFANHQYIQPRKTCIQTGNFISCQ